MKNYTVIFCTLTCLISVAASAQTGNNVPSAQNILRLGRRPSPSVLNFRNAFRIDSAYIQYQSQYNQGRDSVSGAGYDNRFQTASAHFIASVNRIPFTVQYEYRQASGWPFPANLHPPAISFNRDAFVRSISERLRSSFDANSLVAERAAAIQNLKDVALKELFSELLKSLQHYGDDVRRKVQQLGGWNEIMNADKSYLSQKLLGEEGGDRLALNGSLFAKLQEKKNAHEPFDSALYTKSLAALERAKQLQGAVSSIMKYKKKWEESGLVKLINRMEQQKNLQLKEILENPAVLSRLAGNSLPLQKIEKLFLSIRQLETGAGVNNISPLTMSQSLRSSGFSFESISKGNKSLFATLGNIQELGTLQERAVAQGALYQPSTMAAGISFAKNGTGSAQEQFSKLSLFSFASSSSASGLNMLSPISGSVARNLVFTVSKKMSIGSKGSLMTEFSKSAVQQQTDPKSTGTGSNSFAVSNLFNTKDFFSNLGMSIDYSNEFPEIDLAHEMSFRYNGNGYSNQGNSYLFPGSKEISHSLNKSFFKRTLTIVVKNKYKYYSLNNSGKYFTSFSNAFDVRWKFKKGNYVSLKYQPADNTGKEADGMVQNEVTTRRLSADLNLRMRIRKTQVQHFGNLAYLFTRTHFAGVTDELYRSLQLTTSHSVVLSNKQFFVNTSFSHAFQSGVLPYLNSSSLVESGVSYDLGSNVQLSSALNYNAVKGWYSQLAVKQSIAARASKKIEINFSLDAAKNFKVQQAYPVQTLRWDISARYQIW